MDNPIFRVNGRGLEGLTRTIDLACRTRDGHKEHSHRIEGYVIDPKHGFVLLWAYRKEDRSIEASGKFPSALSAEQVAPMVMKWLESDEAWKTPLEEWCDDYDHDGDNSKGWLVYTGDWGHVGPHRYALCAVKPAYLWHGK